MLFPFDKTNENNDAIVQARKLKSVAHIAVLGVKSRTS